MLGGILVAALLAWLVTGGDGGSDPERGGGEVAGVVPPGAGETDAESGLPWIGASELPAEAQETLELIDAGGPFPYPGKDGSTFGNFEGILPEHPDGYYAEYTVPTPGEDDRGARRIVTGEGEESYWTEDHYESFERIWR